MYGYPSTLKGIFFIFITIFFHHVYWLVQLFNDTTDGVVLSYLSTLAFLVRIIGWQQKSRSEKAAPTPVTKYTPSSEACNDSLVLTCSTFSALRLFHLVHLELRSGEPNLDCPISRSANHLA